MIRKTIYLAIFKIESNRHLPDVPGARSKEYSECNFTTMTYMHTPLTFHKAARTKAALGTSLYISLKLTFDTRTCTIRSTGIELTWRGSD